jgi:hypothetical protein
MFNTQWAREGLLKNAPVGLLAGQRKEGLLYLGFYYQKLHTRYVSLVRVS